MKTVYGSVKLINCDVFFLFQGSEQQSIKATGGQPNKMEQSDQDGADERQIPAKDKNEDEGTERDPTKTLLRSIIKSDSTTENLVKVQFWDCGGQAGFYGTHHPFLSYRSFYLLLFDASRNLRSMVKDKDLDPTKREKRSVSGMTYHFLCL